MSQYRTRQAVGPSGTCSWGTTLWQTTMRVRCGARRRSHGMEGAITGWSQGTTRASASTAARAVEGARQVRGRRPSRAGRRPTARGAAAATPRRGSRRGRAPAGTGAPTRESTSVAAAHRGDHRRVERGGADGDGVVRRRDDVARPEAARRPGAWWPSSSLRRSPPGRASAATPLDPCSTEACSRGHGRGRGCPRRAGGSLDPCGEQARDEEAHRRDGAETDARSDGRCRPAPSSW